MPNVNQNYFFKTLKRRVGNTNVKKKLFFNQLTLEIVRVL